MSKPTPKPGRKPTGDIRMRKLHPPRAGAIRSYVSRGGVFVISRLHTQRSLPLPLPLPLPLRKSTSSPATTTTTDAGTTAVTAATPAWELLHQPSGAVVPMRSYAEAVGVVRRIQTPPAVPEGEAGRWVILPRPRPLGGQVLFDRASGRWWGRDAEHPVLEEELEAMSSLRPLESFQREIKVGRTSTGTATTTTTDADVDADTEEVEATKRTARRRS